SSRRLFPMAAARQNVKRRPREYQPQAAPHNFAASSKHIRTQWRLNWAASNVNMSNLLSVLTSTDSFRNNPRQPYADIPSVPLAAVGRLRENNADLQNHRARRNKISDHRSRGGD